MTRGWSFLVGLGLALAQGLPTLYEGNLSGLEYSGAGCANLPTSLPVRLVGAGQQGYLIGPDVPSARLEGQTLTSSLLGTPRYTLRLMGSIGAERLEFEMVLQTPSEDCLLSKALGQLQRATGNPQEWLELAQSEYTANLAMGTDHYLQAAEAFAKAFPLSLKLRGDLPGVWQQRTYQALMLERAGRPGEAFVLYQEARTHLARLLGASNANTLLAQQGVVSTLISLGRYQEALGLTQDLVSKAEQTLGPVHTQTSNALRALANILNGLNRRDEALEIYQTLYSRARQAYGPNDPRTLNLWRAWAGGLYLAGRKEEALRETLALYVQIQRLGSDHYETLMTLEQLANLSLVNAQPGEALKYLALAEAGWGRRLGEDNFTSLRLMSIRASILWNLGRSLEARPLLAQALERLERLRAQPLPPEERRRVLSENLPLYQNYLLLLLELRDLPEAFRVSELTKGRTLLDSLSSQQAVQAAVLPPEVVARLEAQQSAFARLEEALLVAEEPERSNLLAQRLQLSQETAALQQTLAQQYPRYAQLSQPQLLSLEQASAVAPQDGALISFVDFETVVQVFIVTPGQVSTLGLRLPPNFAATLTAYRRLLETPDGALGLERQGQRIYRLSDGSFALRSAREEPPQGAQRISDWRTLSQVLGQALMEPIVAKLDARVRRLVISPDGPLAFLPFETLRVGESLLMERYALSYTPSLSVYAQLRARASRTPGRSANLLALGNPTYHSALRPNSSTTRSLLDTLQKRGFQLVALPGAEREARAAAQIFAPAAQAWIGSEASLARLQALSQNGTLASYRYVLLAAHGFVDPESPEQVAVLLSQSNQDDGVLDLGRVLQLRLQSDLVILSACNTGLGQQVRGEGVMGLAYAFYVAGNLNTLLTLWAINDANSAEFSPRLLERLKAGMPTDEALRQTKLEFLRRPDLAHPAYWAAFVLY
ncbi:MAG: CHAT domain-containing protein [Meiothermus sp.]|nr:CHAT domain-containing protein [Meiothermus sp.]